MKPAFVVLLLIVLLVPALPGLPPLAPAMAQPQTDLAVQAFLDAQPGTLQSFQENDLTAAAIIESNSLYYGLSPRLHLALLETTADLLSDPAPPAAKLQQPFGTAGPHGFAAQIEWASRELRAGLGPYERPPTLRFSDGATVTLTLDQAPEGVAVQRFLAHGRSVDEWHALVNRFNQVFADYFNNELPDPFAAPATGTAPARTAGFLLAPWPLGVNVVHLAYFDHVYPTVDSGDDGNQFVVTYLGRGNVQYDGHDGHDYVFPDQPVGTPILAAAPGYAYARTHRGNGVVIRHADGYETVYWHLDEFAPIFEGRVDTDKSVWVAAGTPLGTSGSSGTRGGTPHLHFEVRWHGRQIDPYGWYGPGPDPCGAYSGCVPSTWLWHSSLYGLYDFTPPDSPPGNLPQLDRNPPVGTLAINPPRDLLLAVPFDGHPLQQVGNGFPVYERFPAFAGGRYNEALQVVDAAALSYPTADNLQPAAGSISLWVEVPARFPANSIDRHYLLAASANPTDSSRVYSGTLALRHEGPQSTGGGPSWTFWSVADDGTSDELSAPDDLTPGWHHFAISWDAQSGKKALYINGQQVAMRSGVELPTAVGPVLQLGRFSYGGGPAGVALDDLLVFNRVLTAAESRELAAANEPFNPSTTSLTGRSLRFDVNATDAEGGIVAVQLGRDGEFSDPQPYYDRFTWALPQQSGSYELAVRYFDRAGNSTVVSQTVTLKLPARTEVYLPLVQR